MDDADFVGVRLVSYNLRGLCDWYPSIRVLRYGLSPGMGNGLEGSDTLDSGTLSILKTDCSLCLKACLHVWNMEQ